MNRQAHTVREHKGHSTSSSCTRLLSTSKPLREGHRRYACIQPAWVLPLIRTPEMWPPLYPGHSESPKVKSMLFIVQSHPLITSMTGPKGGRIRGREFTICTASPTRYHAHVQCVCTYIGTYVRMYVCMWVHHIQKSTGKGYEDTSACISGNQKRFLACDTIRSRI